MNTKQMISEASKVLNMPRAEVEKIYKEYWKTVREYITSLPLKKGLTDEEFQALRPNVNIPSVGKFYVTLDRYRYISDRFLEPQESIKSKQEEHDKHQED